MDNNTQLPLGNTEVIHLKRLNLPVPLRVPDIWGQAKDQPAQISVHLTLSPGFSTAASLDALDESTVHYGQLAKAIQGVVKSTSAEAGAFRCVDAFSTVQNVVKAMAMRRDGSCRLSRFETVIHAPKASLYGDGVDLAALFEYDDGEWNDGRFTLSLLNMRLMVLIGVNDKERTGRQPVIVDLDLHVRPHAVADSEKDIKFDRLFIVEASLVKVGSPGAIDIVKKVPEGDSVLTV